MPRKPKEPPAHAGAPTGNKNASKPAKSRATIWLRVRLTEAQNKTLRADAKKSKLALAKFVRSRLGLQ